MASNEIKTSVLRTGCTILRILRDNDSFKTILSLFSGDGSFLHGGLEASLLPLDGPHALRRPASPDFVFPWDFYEI